MAHHWMLIIQQFFNLSACYSRLIHTSEIWKCSTRDWNKAAVCVFDRVFDVEQKHVQDGQHSELCGCGVVSRCWPWDLSVPEELEPNSMAVPDAGARSAGDGQTYASECHGVLKPDHLQRLTGSRVGANTYYSQRAWLSRRIVPDVNPAAVWLLASTTYWDSLNSQRSPRSLPYWMCLGGCVCSGGLQMVVNNNLFI